jgi:hypothetical protein
LVLPQLFFSMSQMLPCPQHGDHVGYLLQDLLAVFLSANAVIGETLAVASLLRLYQTTTGLRLL